MADLLPDIPGYAVEAELGRGGMGVVYRARRQSDGAVFALKMVLYRRGALFQEVIRFRIEAEALACLDHPNIVKIRDIGFCSGYPFFAMELAERGSLRQEIARGPQKPKWAAEIVRTVALAVQHAHERGMLHRDLKPANVLLMEDGTPKVTDFGLVKFVRPIGEVSDSFSTISLAPRGLPFGRNEDSEDEEIGRLWEAYAVKTGVPQGDKRLQAIRASLKEARAQANAITGAQADAITGQGKYAGLGLSERLESLRATLTSPGIAWAEPTSDVPLTQEGTVIGSPNYMAPEQAMADQTQVRPQTDVYALGGILYELLTGRPPFETTGLAELLTQVCLMPPVSPRQFIPTLSADIEAICHQCLEKSPADRYDSAAALADDLSRFLDGYEPTATRSAWARSQCGSLANSQDVPSALLPGTADPTRQLSSIKSWWPLGRRKPNATTGTFKRPGDDL